MLFHMAAADNGSPEAWWSAPQQYQDGPERLGESIKLLAGGQVHYRAPVAESDRILAGSGTVLKTDVESIRAIRDSSKTTWEFCDGSHVYIAVIEDWTVVPIGGGHATLTFKLRVVSRRA